MPGSTPDGGKFGLVEGLWGAVENNDDTLKLPKHADQKQVDATLAQDLNQLSLQERETAYEELHGVAPEIEETPELVSEHLAMLQTELMKIQDKPAYDLAYQMDSSYIDSRKFRLMFLRAERFDAKLAAQRLVTFLEKKRHFFGDDSLVRSLNQRQDLTPDDLATMKAGANQILTVRDNSGRMVIVDLGACGPQLYTSLMSHVSVTLDGGAY